MRNKGQAHLKYNRGLGVAGFASAALSNLEQALLPFFRLQEHNFLKNETLPGHTSPSSFPKKALLLAHFSPAVVPLWIHPAPLCHRVWLEKSHPAVSGFLLEQGLKGKPKSII